MSSAGRAPLGDDSARASDAPAASGVLRVFPPTAGASRVVLIRHGEAECNVNHVVGGTTGCTGLTDLGRRQVAALADRLYVSGELRGAAALYASVLPRAVETADRLRAVIGPGPAALGPVVERCDLCELHPGKADAMVWEDVVESFGLPNWDEDPAAVIAPGGESWTEFVARASAALRDVATAHPGQLVVAAVHAGVIEATLISFLGIAPSVARRGWVRIRHASLTEWEWVPDQDRWILLRFNDACGIPRA